MSRIYTAAVLVIGNEILSGRTQDANIGYLGRRLNELGIRLLEVRILPDLQSALVPALRRLKEDYDYLFTTGGIGPTHDDITVDCVAAAFERPVIEHPEARRLLEDYYGDRINDARLRMARTPEGAGLIENPVSRAPGIKIENVFVLAGVPRIMQAQFEALAPDLVGGLPMQSVSLPVAMPESEVAPGLGALQERYPDVEMGSYPYMRDGRVGTSLVLRATDEARLKAATDELRDLIAALGGGLDEDM
ncbi:competence/damage-inducible protein A [Aquibaculum arenosum]|uniref:Molybdopterin-binding protein n=1 Tax=Aquibaculum arenosum TaxID=3032591 RepID=A0ABT5YLN6_9PROT|nr:molybdopterin-binding protein [Fodinicurvata sp. CAU 1616]MDF2095863.1 molybdopterin-binding protein [Fodinicurvata sp. CAU 1616]